MRVLDHYVPPQVLLIACTDFLLAFGSLYIAYFFVESQGFAQAVSPGLELFSQAVLLGLVVTAAMAAMGLYNVKLRTRIEGMLARMLVGVSLATIAIALLEFVFRFVDSRPVWLIAFSLCAVLLGLVRTILPRLINDEVFRRRVLVYGAGQRAACILQLRRRSDQRGFRIVGFIPAAGDAFVIQDPRVVIQQMGRPLLEYVRSGQVDEIVIGPDDRRRSFPIDELLACKLAGVNVVDLLEFLERETGRLKVELINPSWLIFSDGFSNIGAQLRFRALDLAVVIVLSLFALPVALVVAIAIVVDDGCPFIYSQRRIGLDGKEFVLYKFRSMRKDAEATGSPRWASVEDDRVTRVGKWLRKLRLDELPQLLNVLKGDMSLVGPRPERPEFVRDLSRKIPYYHERHCVRPGLTGWAQLCYPYGASDGDARAKLEYDMFYIKNRSLVFDLMILLQTVEVVLWQRGAR